MNRQQASILCLDCGICCSTLHNQGLVQNRRERQVVLEFGGSLISNRAGRLCFIQPCPAFDGSCSVYASRPASCRGYECYLFDLIETGTIQIAQAKKIIDNIKAEIACIDAGLEDMLGKRSLILDEYFTLFLEKIKGNSPLKKQYQDVLLRFGTYAYLREKYFDRQEGEDYWTTEQRRKNDQE